LISISHRLLGATLHRLIIDPSVCCQAVKVRPTDLGESLETARNRV